jgi:hypothetical protein
VMVVCGPCQESTSSTQERCKQLRRKRFQKGSLQIRKHGRHRVWVACYWEGGGRRSKVLGRCSQMGKGEAESILSAILQPINKGLAREPKPVYTFEQFVESVYLRSLGNNCFMRSVATSCRTFSTGARWYSVPAS